MHLEETAGFSQNIGKTTRLVTIFRSNGVAVHRIANPGNRTPVNLNRLGQGWQTLFNQVCPHAGNKADAPAFTTGVKPIHKRIELIRASVRTDLDPNRVTHT